VHTSGAKLVHAKLDQHKHRLTSRPSQSAPLCPLRALQRLLGVAGQPVGQPASRQIIAHGCGPLIACSGPIEAGGLATINDEPAAAAISQPAGSTPLGRLRRLSSLPLLQPPPPPSLPGAESATSLAGPFASNSAPACSKGKQTNSQHHQGDSSSWNWRLLVAAKSRSREHKLTFAPTPPIIRLGPILHLNGDSLLLAK